jgi:RNA-directed DNA polymerase
VLKAILTNCAKHGPREQNRDDHPDFRAYLSGRIAYVAMIHPMRGSKLWSIFDRIDWKACP